MRAIAAVAVAAALLTGCARVKPYQREVLTLRALQQAPWSAVERHDLHVFEVREGSNGATGTAGGGCGCN